MTRDAIRIGFVGLGANSRLRHVPGLRACEGVEIVAVCNRSETSTRAVADELEIPRTFSSWELLVRDPQIDAVVVGTWPNMHCPVVLAALEAGKHVLTEARMAMDLGQAHQMLQASRRHPEQVAQIVPSPLGLRCGQVVEEWIEQGRLGELREIVVLGTSDVSADAATPIHWRQRAALSGRNMLTLGILHETLIRWVGDPVRVTAQGHTFTRRRPDAEGGGSCPVDVPDTVHVLCEWPGGTRGLYHLSSAIRFGPGHAIHLYGSEGTLKYLLAPEDRLDGAQRGESSLHEIEVPLEKQEGWCVEQDFIGAIRGEGPVRLTDFATGVRYMEFTEAVSRSIETAQPVQLPLDEQ